MSNTKKLIDAIREGDDSMANAILLKSLRSKINETLEIKRIAITNDFLNKGKNFQK